MRWSYGVMTVPERRETTLPTTLKSLALAGFDKPRLFIDGSSDGLEYDEFKLPTTCRYPNVRTAANWVLSIYELYLREPDCERFALFQDDFVICRNSRSYLDSFSYGYHSQPIYWNLHSFPVNEELKPPGLESGWYDSNQMGKSAIALVFDRAAIVKLMASEYLVTRPQDLQRGHQSIDGGIVVAMMKAGYKEQVHYPCLTQHIGKVSAMGHGMYPLSKTFPGEDFDAMELLKCSEIPLSEPLKESVSIVNL